MSRATPADLDHDLESERTHLTESREALGRMRRRAEEMYATGDRVAGDPFGAESLGRALARRIAELTDDPTAPLFFGRLDFGPADPDHGDHTYHIGRRHVVDDRGEPMVLDWRAPVSRAFYRASARDPQGVEMRRRFGWAYGAGAAQLTSFEDEHLDRGEELGTTSKILTTEIERPRVGPMRDIVATIQPDQDELVRAELDTSVCVQGAPGTGKTAVGLHRAAYLLYLHRDRLRRSGVLILGPNSAFLRYIAAVLPALGEIDVTQATLGDLFATEVTTTDTPEAETVKHDVRMATVLRRALHAGIAKPTEPIEVPDGSYRWRISVDALRRIVDDVRRSDPPYATGRERVRARVVALLQRQSEARRAESPGDAWLRRMARAKPVTGFLDAAWPAATAEGLVAGLLTDPDALARAADGVLTPDEQAAIVWAKPPRSARAVRWTAADAVLVDEAAGLIERPASFGHIVVDEAQDLSPMQARAIARRSEHAAVTLLGDLAQGTTPWAARTWQDTLAHLGKPDTAVVPLTTGFRVPAQVLTLANRLLPALDVDVPPAVSLRHDGQLTVTHTDDLTTATVTSVRDALIREGSIGVITPAAQVDQITRALSAAGIETAAADADTSALRVTVLPATIAKGLEYDHVVVVEPAAIVAAEPRGLNRLYVVLTRAVTGLAIVHTTPLPPSLT
ncbi:MAG TPA: AAA family ATPase [Micromonosporaceae bacterium]|nr:AAA family ATPase [Micromonosporaceae bacterium]